MLDENPLEKFKYKKHSGDVYVVEISKEQLKNTDIVPVIDAIYNARALKEKGPRVELPLSENIKADKQIHASLIIYFDGYDEDLHDVYDMDETKKFYKKLLNEIPGLIYYLENVQIILLFKCLFNNKTEDNQPVLNTLELTNFLEKKIPETMSWIKNKFHRDDFKERIDILLKTLYESSQQVRL